jgi:hypothetical protein
MSSNWLQSYTNAIGMEKGREARIAGYERTLDRELQLPLGSASVAALCANRCPAEGVTHSPGVHAGSGGSRER